MAADERDPAAPGGSFSLPVVEGPTGLMARVQSFAGRDEADAAARTLIEQGIGAAVVEDGHGHDLLVIPELGRRAAEVLGLVAPDPAAPRDPAPAAKITKPRLPLRQLLLIWAVMLVVVPLVAGLISYWLVSR